MKNTLKRMSIILLTVCVLVSTFASSMGVMAAGVETALEALDASYGPPGEITWAPR